jgi:hypothetical protein
MMVLAPDRLTDQDVTLRKWYPSAVWVVNWLDGETRASNAYERAISTARQCCSHPYHHRFGYTFIVFDDYDDAMMTYLALV